MAEDISDICREYVAQHAAGFATLGENAAVEALTKGAHMKLRKAGWDGSDADYSVDIEDLVRQKLKRNRA